MDDQGAQPTTADELLIGRDTGVWAVRSTSTAVYYVDLGTDGIAHEPGRPGPLLLRSPGPDSSHGPWDGCWVALVSVEDSEGQGRVRVGHRHRWTMDPGGWRPIIWWIQRAVTGIERLEAAQRPVGRVADTSETHVPFTRQRLSSPEAQTRRTEGPTATEDRTDQ